MVEEQARRKLSAILSADVKGFSRLMSQDEEATVKTLKQHRITISGLVTEHRGRVVDSPGDNILAEFGSVVDAVRCAVKIQETLKGRNAELPENRRMEFRIVVNLGYKRGARHNERAAGNHRPAELLPSTAGYEDHWVVSASGGQLYKQEPGEAFASSRLGKSVQRCLK